MSSRNWKLLCTSHTGTPNTPALHWFLKTSIRARYKNCNIFLSANQWSVHPNKEKPGALGDSQIYWFAGSTSGGLYSFHIRWPDIFNFVGTTSDDTPLSSFENLNQAYPEGWKLVHKSIPNCKWITGFTSPPENLHGDIWDSEGPKSLRLLLCLSNSLISLPYSIQFGKL